MLLAIALFLSFLCGSIPFGVFIARSRGVDIRSVGSGNIGATNVWRVLGPKWGGVSFVLDVAKGVAGPVIGRAILGENATVEIALCGVAAVLGHTFSPFLGFKGGKGIATSLGAMLGLMPLVGISIAAVWTISLAVSRMVSVASVVSCVALPILAWVLGAPPPFVVVAVSMGVVAFLKHIPNLKRIAAGTEPKVGQKKAAPNENASGENAPSEAAPNKIETALLNDEK